MPYLGKKEIKRQNRKLILNLVPRKPKKIQSKNIFKKAVEAGLSTATIVKHLAELVKRGDLKRIQVTHKEVYYQQTESAELTLKLIKLTTVWTIQLEKIYSHLNKEERQVLLGLMDTVMAQIGPIYEKYAKEMAKKGKT